LAIRVSNNYILKSIYTTIFLPSPFSKPVIITINQYDYLSANIMIALFIAAVLIVLIITTIKSIWRKKYKYIIIDESNFFLVDINGNETKLKYIVLEIRNPLLNILFSPNSTAVHLCVLRDCYAKFEDETICGVDLNLSDYFRVKKMNLKNVKFFKIRYYLQWPFS
jgi:hypothetical protein